MNDRTLDDVAIRSLAQFRPFEGRAERMEGVHAELVEAACQTQDGGFASVAECQAFIQRQWKTELETNEIAAARKYLEGQDRVEKNGAAIWLTEAAHKDLDDQRESWERAELKAMEEWEAAVRKEYPFLEGEDIAALKSQLRPWLDQVIACRGLSDLLCVVRATTTARTQSRCEAMPEGRAQHRDWGGGREGAP